MKAFHKFYQSLFDNHLFAFILNRKDAEGAKIYAKNAFIFLDFLAI